MVCVDSGIVVPEEDEFVYPGCCRNHRIQIIIDLALILFKLVIVGALALTFVVCLFPDKGSLSAIRRSFMSFVSPESLLTRRDLMENPTPASRRSSFLLHSRRKCNQHQLLLKALPLQDESHSELQFRLCIGQVLYQLELFFAEVCQNQHCPLECGH